MPDSHFTQIKVVGNEKSGDSYIRQTKVTADADLSLLDSTLTGVTFKAIDIEALNAPKVRQRSVPCNPALSQLAKSKKVLLLQGPVGSFYDRLTRWLQAGGVEVHRVVFQGGDEHDCKLLNPVAYRGALADWPAFLETLMTDLGIDCVVLFGQSRRYHAKARAVALVQKIHVVVLEEGYFRPGFMTMELGGVNGYSATMQHYLWRPVTLVQEDRASLVPLDELQPDISP